MKILLVDDEMFTIRMLQNLIHWEQLGLEVMGMLKGRAGSLPYDNGESAGYRADRY